MPILNYVASSAAGAGFVICNSSSAGYRFGVSYDHLLLVSSATFALRVNKLLLVTCKLSLYLVVDDTLHARLIIKLDSANRAYSDYLIIQTRQIILNYSNYKKFVHHLYDRTATTVNTPQLRSMS